MDNISIHALCEEGDPENVVISKMPEISIHALCEEGDGAGLLLSTCKQLFLSTPSARRATVLKGPQARRRQDFYPRPLRGGRPRQCDLPPPGGDFYPRPLRGGRH